MGGNHLGKKHGKAIRMKSSKSFYEEFDHYDRRYFNSPEETVIHRMRQQATDELADMVEKLYARGLGTYKISEELLQRGMRASPDMVRRMLKKRGVKLRPPNNRNQVPAPLEQQAIAITEAHDANTALEYLEDHGYPVHIKTIRRWLREKHKTYRPLPPDIEEIVKQATQRYLQEKIGAYKLAQRFKQQGTDIKPRTLLSYIKRHTTIRSNKESLHLAAKHQTKPFSGDADDMYYLMGFRTGDLHVKPASNYRILVSCTSSLPAFEKLFQQLFARYGNVENPPETRVTKDGYFVCERRHRVYLERPSFDFLLTKGATYITDEEFFSFLSGFIDAEGCINISSSGRKKAKYVSAVTDFGNKDRQILESIRQGLLNRGIHANIRETRTPLGEPYCRVYVKRKSDVLTLLRKLRLRHEDKQEMRNLVLQVLEHELRWPEAEQLVEAVRQRTEQRRRQFWREILDESSSRRLQRDGSRSRSIVDRSDRLTSLMIYSRAKRLSL